MIATFISFLIVALLVALGFALFVWVASLFGFPLPQNVIKIIGAILFLIVVLYFLNAFVGGTPVVIIRGG